MASAVMAATATSTMATLGTQMLSARGIEVQRVPLTRPSLRRSIVVRADAEDAKDSIQTAIDSTKIPISKEGVERNMATNQSEKQSVFGATPAPGSLPRDEIERRPETGNMSFGSIMAFDGPGPETINGRLAMTGCVWAFISEAMTHKTIWQQITEPYNTGFFWLVAATNIIIFASLVPLFNGESPDSRSNGPFNAKAERWNGRLAMVGYAGILAYEFAAQRSLL